ncbi:hypothetical protein ACH40E_14810 [Streptomyces acidicola]|uniref:hypothetical protein n=1 Tax=Streptomyces acidicola TaxID=2596892 RepID=UPI00378BF2F2
MARHSAPRPLTVRRVVLALTTAGIGLGVGATATAADAGPGQDPVFTRPVALGRNEPGAGAEAVTGSVRHVTSPVETLKPNPLAGTGVDPLDNGVGTQVADFKPVTSRAVTRPVAQAPSVSGIPLLGQIPGLLHG